MPSDAWHLWRRILVPVRLSAPSRHVLEWSWQLAQPVRGEVCVLYPCRFPLDGAPAAGLWAPSQLEKQANEAIRRKTQQELLCWVARTEPPANIAQACLMVTGDPADRIVSAAKAWGSDLIVLGGEWRSRGPLRWLQGSVAEQVVRTSPCPVLCVGVHFGGAMPPDQASA